MSLTNLYDSETPKINTEDSNKKKSTAKKNKKKQDDDFFYPSVSIANDSKGKGKQKDKNSNKSNKGKEKSSKNVHNNEGNKKVISKQKNKKSVTIQETPEVFADLPWHMTEEEIETSARNKRAEGSLKKSKLLEVDLLTPNYAKKQNLVIETTATTNSLSKDSSKDVANTKEKESDKPSQNTEISSSSVTSIPDNTSQDMNQTTDSTQPDTSCGKSEVSASSFIDSSLCRSQTQSSMTFVEKAQNKSLLLSSLVYSESGDDSVFESPSYNIPFTGDSELRTGEFPSESSAVSVKPDTESSKINNENSSATIEVEKEMTEQQFKSLYVENPVQQQKEMEENYISTTSESNTVKPECKKHSEERPDVISLANVQSDKYLLPSDKLELSKNQNLGKIENSQSVKDINRIIRNTLQDGDKILKNLSKGSNTSTAHKEDIIENSSLLHAQASTQKENSNLEVQPTETIVSNDPTHSHKEQSICGSIPSDLAIAETSSKEEVKEEIVPFKLRMKRALRNTDKKADSWTTEENNINISVANTEAEFGSQRSPVKIKPTSDAVEQKKIHCQELYSNEDGHRETIVKGDATEDSK